MLIEATKDNKEYDTVKKHGEENNTPDRVKAIQRNVFINCKYWWNMNECHWGAQHMTRDTQDKGRQTTLIKYAEARVGQTHRDKMKCRAVHNMYQDHENTEVATQLFDMLGSECSTFRAWDQY